MQGTPFQDRGIVIANAAITKSGQASIPRAVADQIGAEYGKDRIDYVQLQDGTILIRRQPTFFEQLKSIHDSFTPEQKAAAKRLGQELDHKSVGEVLDEWTRSPKGKKYMKEKYGI